MSLFLLQEHLAVLLQHLVDRCFIPRTRYSFNRLLPPTCRANKRWYCLEQLLERRVVTNVRFRSLSDLPRRHIQHQTLRRDTIRGFSLTVRVLMLAISRYVVLHLDSLMHLQAI